CGAELAHRARGGGAGPRRLGRHAWRRAHGWITVPARLTTKASWRSKKSVTTSANPSGRPAPIREPASETNTRWQPGIRSTKLRLHVGAPARVPTTTRVGVVRDVSHET